MLAWPVSGAPLAERLDRLVALETDVELERQLVQRNRRQQFPPVLDAGAEVVNAAQFRLVVQSAVQRQDVPEDLPQRVGLVGVPGSPVSPNDQSSV